MRLFTAADPAEVTAHLLATGRYRRHDRALCTDDLWISVRRNTVEANGPANAHWPTTIEVDTIGFDDATAALAQLRADLPDAVVSP